MEDTKKRRISKEEADKIIKTQEQDLQPRVTDEGRQMQLQEQYMRSLMTQQQFVNIQFHNIKVANEILNANPTEESKEFVKFVLSQITNIPQAAE